MISMQLEWEEGEVTASFLLKIMLQKSVGTQRAVPLHYMFNP